MFVVIFRYISSIYYWEKFLRLIFSIYYYETFLIADGGGTFSLFCFDFVLLDKVSHYILPEMYPFASLLQRDISNVSLPRSVSKQSRI